MILNIVSSNIIIIAVHVDSMPAVCPCAVDNVLQKRMLAVNKIVNLTT